MQVEVREHRDAELVHLQPEPVRARRRRARAGLRRRGYKQAVHGADPEPEAARQLGDPELPVGAGEGLQHPRRVADRRQRCCGPLRLATRSRLAALSAMRDGRLSGSGVGSYCRIAPSWREPRAERARGPSRREPVWSTRGNDRRPPRFLLDRVDRILEAFDAGAHRPHLARALSPAPGCPRPPCTARPEDAQPWAGSSATEALHDRHPAVRAGDARRRPPRPARRGAADPAGALRGHPRDREPRRPRRGRGAVPGEAGRPQAGGHTRAESADGCLRCAPPWARPWWPTRPPEVAEQIDRDPGSPRGHRTR